MQRWKNEKLALIITIASLLLLCLPAFGGLPFERREQRNGAATVFNYDDESTEPEGRAVDYIDTQIIGAAEFYAGDQDKGFTLFIRENNGGEEFDDTEGGPGNESWNNYNIFSTTVVIREFRDENGKQISGTNNPFVGFMSGHSSADNGDGGDGFMVQGSRTWYASEDNDDFIPNVKKSVIPGDYTLSLVVNYKIRLAWDPVSEDYDYATRSEDELIPVTILSGLGVQSETEIKVYDPNDNPGATLYAGALYQKIGVTGLSSEVDKVGDLEGTLAFTGNDITVPDTYKKASKNEQDAWPTATLFWRINVKEDANPGIYDVRLTLSYVRYFDDGDDGNDIDITESSILLRISIGFTPRLSPPDSEGLTVEITDIDQEGNGKATLDVTLYNRGNVDLIDIEAWLDLSNARYFYTTDFYYDEDDFALKKDLGTEQTIETLGTGSSKELSFNINVRNDIPPGKYIIPIKYTAKYFDTGVFGGSSIDVDTTEAEYHNIMLSQGKTEPDDKSYIYLLIEDSLLDLEATTPNRLQPGMVEANLRVNLQNVDGYDLTKLNVTIPYTAGMPIKPAGGKDAFEVHFDDNLDSGWTIPFDFIVDVEEKAALGIHEIPLRMICRNELEEEISINVKFELDIVPIPPEIVVVRVETPEIEEEEGFRLEVVIMNVGGSKATNISALLIDSNNEFESGSSDALVTAEPFDLAPGETKKITYKLTAQSIDPAGKYNLSVRVQYRDSKGNMMRYSQNEPLPVLLKTEAEGAMSAAPWRDWVYLILGILFLAVLCLLPFLYYKIHYKYWKKREKKLGNIKGKDKKKEKKSETPAQKPALPVKEKKPEAPRAPNVSGPAATPRAPAASAQPNIQHTPPSAYQQQAGQDVPRPPNVPFGAYEQRMLPEHHMR